ARRKEGSWRPPFPVLRSCVRHPSEKFGHGGSAPRVVGESARGADRVEEFFLAFGVVHPQHHTGLLSIDDGHFGQILRPVVAGPFDLHLQDPGAYPLALLNEGFLCHDAALVDDAHGVAQALHEIELMAGEEHRNTGLATFAQHLENGVQGRGIEPGEGLVQDEQVGLVDERHRQLDLLLVAQRERFQSVSTVEFDLQPFQPQVGPAARLPPIMAVDAGEVHELGPGAHTRVQAPFLWDVTEAVPDGVVDGFSLPADLPAVRGQESQGDAHRRGLSCPVRSAEPEHLSRAYLQAQPTQDLFVLEVLLQVVELQHQFLSWGTSSNSVRTELASPSQVTVSPARAIRSLSSATVRSVLGTVAMLRNWTAAWSAGSGRSKLRLTSASRMRPPLRRAACAQLLRIRTADSSSQSARMAESR